MSELDTTARSPEAQSGARLMSAPRESVRLDGQGALRRSHLATEVGPALVDGEVVVMGWVHSHRDHGGVIFVDLRDRSGLLQLVFRPDVASRAHARAEELHREFVLAARGVVRPRATEDINPKLPTGEIEIEVHELCILNSAVPPPFAIENETEVDEQVRLRHRLHDLRRPVLQNALALRHRVYQSVRSTLAGQGFLEIETPMLTKATPEGARDFLVPSRQYPGAFYALPQSPQLLKQLLMIAGFDRYFQIARCFRDEDQRADRQLEFTQVDLEMSFVAVDDVLQLLEALTARVFAEAGGVALPRPFPRLSYADAMLRYGSDCPDTRIELELVDLTDLFRESDFRAFHSVVESGGIVKCLPVHDADALSRGELDRLELFVRKELGARGLAWIRVGADGAWQGPIVKFLSESERAQIARRTAAQPGSLLFFQADSFEHANTILARLRSDLGARLGRSDGRAWAPLFIVDFPLFVREEGRLQSAHMPFVAPLDEDIPLLESASEKVRATHYDVVLNGNELGSGSLRNHRSAVQRAILSILGYAKDQMEQQFGFLLNALDSGAPPHGGFAYGLDRIVMLLAGTDNLRDVIAFPKTQRGQELLMESPGEVARAQLDELHLRVVRERGES